MPEDGIPDDISAISEDDNADRQVLPRLVPYENRATSASSHSNRNGALLVPVAKGLLLLNLAVSFKCRCPWIWKALRFRWHPAYHSMTYTPAKTIIAVVCDVLSSTQPPYGATGKAAHRTREKFVSYCARRTRA